MVTTSARVLRLLSLLQVRRDWPGRELSSRLGIDVRTVRRDVDRLRQLGYAIAASSGPGGGYRLGPGSATPPLLLEDDEAIAVAVALGAAAGSVAMVHDVGLRVLAKLDQLMPRRLRRRLSALPEVTVSLGPARAAVSPTALAAIAGACRDQVQLRFGYRDRQGVTSSRRVEPMRLIHTGSRWYLAAWDIDRGDWRTFRVDRVDAAAGFTEGPRFTPRQTPEDLATFVARSLASSQYPFRVRLRLPQSAESLADRLPHWVGVLEPIDARSCMLNTGGDSPEAIAAIIVHAGLDYTLVEPASLAAPLRAIARRLSRGLRRAAARSASARRQPGRARGAARRSPA
jgi:predicted DNA-binding transcriptional regulator YafY